MQVPVYLFGQLTDIAGNNSMVLSDVADTDALLQAVNSLYPAMAGINYVIAVDKKIVRTNTVLNEKTQVALLPPFSGG